MYDRDTGTVTAALQSGNTAVFTDDTISKILALTTTDNNTVSYDLATPNANGVVTVAAGAELVLVTSSDTTQTLITPPANAPVLIFQGKGGVDVTINDGATTVPAHPPGVTDRVVIGTAGNDHIVIADAKNTAVTLGTGHSTVVAGAGQDTILAGLGNSTISGGTGHAIVELKGNAADYTVTVDNGHAVVTHAGDAHITDITKIQYVQLDNGKALVFANDSQEAAVTTLYQAAFGRDADAGGLDFYFKLAQEGYSLKQIAQLFMDSPENQPAAAQSDSDFISNLYLHTFARAGEADGVAYWTDALAHGATRAELVAAFANVAALNVDGSMHTEATVVGSVTIVHNIV